MDFFAHQDRARRQTSLLVFYFGLAVVLIVLAVYLAFWVVLNAAALKTRGSAALPLWEPQLLVWVCGGTVAVIAGGTFFKILQLRGGGAAVAGLLGGTPVLRGTQDFRQRQLLNVVEEMAIAAGVPVPAAYVLEREDGINAFAAGLTPDDAVVGVTRGCLERLSRDELQGVVAHEFSHILNGDMRLNLRLMGVLHGILIIALLGYVLFRSVLYARVGSSSRRGKEGGGRMAIVLLGVALIVIGYVGVFFARLIQSAVSRQREFLADASAVQFTRNPPGLAGALKKIGALVVGSRLEEPNARAASHLFFGNALRPAWFSWTATHPPLTERIRRLEPTFDGQLPTAAPRPALADARPAGQAGALPGLVPGAAALPALAGAAPVGRVAWDPAALVAQIGAPTGAHLEFAARLRQALPAALVEAMQSPAGAQAVLYCLVLDAAPAVRRTQLAALKAAAPPDVGAEVDRLQAPVDALPAGYRIAVLDLALPALKDLPAAALAAFQQTVRQLAEADQEINLFEYALQAVLKHRLRAWLEPNASAQVEYYSLNPVRAQCRLLLSALAHLGAGEVSAERAFSTAAAPLGTVGALGLVPAEQCSLAAVDQALEGLSRLAHPLRRRVLTACTQLVLADRQVQVDEAELLRAIAATLDCPMPPLLADSPLAV